MHVNDLSRREFLAITSALGLSGLVPAPALAQARMPVRPIPGTDESLPIIGLGSSKVVTGVAENGPGPLDEVIRTLVEYGGTVIDTWPRNPGNDAALGDVISAGDLVDRLFVTTKIDQQGEQAGIDQFARTLALYQRNALDLTQVFSLTDLEVQWPSLRGWKEEGRTRYIGVTVSNERLYPQLEGIPGAGRSRFYPGQLLDCRAQGGGEAFTAGGGSGNRCSCQPAVHERILF